MAKTNEELNILKTEFQTLTTKLQELTDDELKIVTGGTFGINHDDFCHFDPIKWVLASGCGVGSGSEGWCKHCAYNTNRNWEISSCDYPTMH